MAKVMSRKPRGNYRPAQLTSGPEYERSGITYACVSWGPGNHHECFGHVGVWNPSRAFPCQCRCHRDQDLVVQSRLAGMLFDARMRGDQGYYDRIMAADAEGEIARTVHNQIRNLRMIERRKVTT